MQPYLFPYIGYFQLIKEADLFIVYDDVQWIKGGWINRNRITENGSARFITLPIKPDSHTKYINERYFSLTFERDKSEIKNIIQKEYCEAPFFSEVMKLLDEIFLFNDRNAATFVTHTIKVLCEYLEIKTPIILSSEIGGRENNLSAQDRVIDVVVAVGGKSYVNAIGGINLYNKDSFLDNGIELSFIKPRLTNYPQKTKDFIPGLSIIDVIMFNSKRQLKEILSKYEII